MELETVDEIAERLERTADRYRNARDFERESEGRLAAKLVRASSDISEAREAARIFAEGQKPAASLGNAMLGFAGKPVQRPWWKRWRRGQTDDS